MNERLRELIDECTEWITGTIDGDIECFDKEKFAQLIARECARLAMTQSYSASPAEYHDMEPYEQGCDDTASAISGLICRTFGVE